MDNKIINFPPQEPPAPPAPPAADKQYYALEVSTTGEYWKTHIIGDDLPTTRAMAKTIIEEGALRGIGYARVMPVINPIYLYSARVLVEEIPVV